MRVHISPDKAHSMFTKFSKPAKPAQNLTSLLGFLLSLGL